MDINHQGSVWFAPVSHKTGGFPSIGISDTEKVFGRLSTGVQNTDTVRL
jgi:hypothetical protein